MGGVPENMKIGGGRKGVTLTAQTISRQKLGDKKRDRESVGYINPDPADASTEKKGEDWN